jgi:para-aminobenzoate synthetase
MRTLLIDNYDSFTYNLYQLLGRVLGRVPTVLRNDDRDALAALELTDFDAIIVSPGPGSPEHERDFGISRWAVAQEDLPVLGICLGHQGMWQVNGARVARTPEPVHGRLSDVFHDGDSLFDGLPSPFPAVRYHSLAVYDLPAHVKGIAHTADGLLMAARHREHRKWGVQFHPESIATAHGERLIANFRDLVGAATATGHCGPTVAAVPVRSATVRSDLTMSVREVTGGVEDAETAFAALFGGDVAAFWLDSSRVIPGMSQFSVMGGAHGPLAEVITYDVRRREVTVSSGTGVEIDRRSQNIFEYLAEQLDRRRIPPGSLPFDFDFGYVGSLGYELKADCGAAAPHPSPQPDASLIFADRALVIDHRDKRAWLLALGSSDMPADPWLAEAQSVLAAAEPLPDLPPLEADRTLAVNARHTEEEYAALIAACHRAIAAGESYEICLTNVLSISTRIDPWQTYRVLRRVNPAPYAAYLRFTGYAVLSSSPERFLRIDAAGEVESKPIKGTRPRGRTPEEDARLAAELLGEEKERAENLMIVDLVRNDIGRVAVVGSVHVPVLFGVETYQTVHQLVSTVRGTIAPPAGAIDCVRAAFPGGSMTGAPKLRTMEIIDELEQGARGIYSGAIGFFSLSGAVDMSIAIRCMVVTDDEVRIGVGGAITALSDPTAEIEETWVKARALLRAVACADLSVAATR